MILFPRQILFAKVTIVHSLSINRAQQIKFMDDICNREIEVFQYDFLQLFV